MMNTIKLNIIGLEKEDDFTEMFTYEFKKFDKIDFMESIAPVFDDICDNAKRDLGLVVGLNYKKFPEKSFMSYLTLESIKYVRKGIIEMSINRLSKSIIDTIKELNEGEKNDR